MNQQGANSMAEVQCHCGSDDSRMATHKRKVRSCVARAMKAYGGAEVQLHSVLTSETDAGESSASRPGRLNTRCPFTNC